MLERRDQGANEGQREVPKVRASAQSASRVLHFAGQRRRVEVRACDERWEVDNKGVAHGVVEPTEERFDLLLAAQCCCSRGEEAHAELGQRGGGVVKQRGESAHLIAHTQSVVESRQGSADSGEDVVEEERGFGPAAEAHCLAALPHESGVAEER